MIELDEAPYRTPVAEPLNVALAAVSEPSAVEYANVLKARDPTNVTAVLKMLITPPWAAMWIAASPTIE